MYSKNFEKEFKKLDKGIQKFISAWINKNLDGTTNPRSKGKGLVDNHSGEWRYRIGDYRLLCEIQENTLVILALHIGHRSVVYRKKKIIYLWPYLETYYMKS
ncbi:MAG: type II toxin-antitoxin system RelE/ParE family toxin [Lachnospiraceae bacterium]|nr:type II toxin-antitoxin system RelE/ParE family toxin [Lachnospiraceae bacterium]